MAQRKLSTSRAYSLTKGLVNILAAILLYLAISRAAGYDEYERYFLNLYDEKCTNLTQEEKTYMPDLCLRYLERPNELFRSIFTLGASGIGLLILFYGGTWLYKYLYVEEPKG